MTIEEASRHNLQYISDLDLLVSPSSAHSQVSDDDSSSFSQPVTQAYRSVRAEHCCSIIDMPSSSTSGKLYPMTGPAGEHCNLLPENVSSPEKRAYDWSPQSDFLYRQTTSSTQLRDVSHGAKSQSASTSSNEKDQRGVNNEVQRPKEKVARSNGDGPVKAACLSCRNKKAKCDGMQPTCGQVSHVRS